MAYPIIKSSSTWFTPNRDTIKRNTITIINIVDSYTPTEAAVVDSWDASVAQDGSIMVYVENTILTIAGNGSGNIKTNEDASWMFSDSNDVDFFNLVTSINGLNILDTSLAENMSHMFYRCDKLTTIDVSTFNTSNTTNMSYMFGTEYGGSMGLTSINFGSNFVKSSVTDLSYMFYYCSKLVALDIDDWDISNVVNMSNFSRACSKLTTFGTNNLKDWDFGNVIYLDQAFRGLQVMPKLAIENWNVSKVETMYCLFTQNTKMFSNLDLKGWNVSNVKDMGFVFWGCKALRTLDCGGWNVSNVVTFDHFIAQSGGITNFNTTGWNVSSNCKNLNGLFHSYKGTYIDIRGWDTSNVEVFCQMFDACSNLTKIDGLNELNTSNGRDFTQMFWSTTKLEEMDLSNFDTRKAVDNYPLGANETFGDGMSGMFASGVHANLKKIVLGKNFSFNGDGSLTGGCCAVLPTPSSGCWYTIVGKSYAPADVPNLTAATYYSTEVIVDDLTVLVTTGLLRGIANAIREKNGSTDKYYPNDFAAEILKL